MRGSKLRGENHHQNPTPGKRLGSPILVRMRCNNEQKLWKPRIDTNGHKYSKTHRIGVAGETEYPVWQRVRHFHCASDYFRYFLFKNSFVSIRGSCLKSLCSSLPYTTFVLFILTYLARPKIVKKLRPLPCRIW